MHLLSRIAHRLEWLNSFKHVGKGTVTDNPLSEQLHGWKENREDGVKVHEMMPTSIGGASQSWLRSHQSQDKAGPCSIAWACNKRADDLAAEAANQASANISYLDARDADKGVEVDARCKSMCLQGGRSGRSEGGFRRVHVCYASRVIW